MNDKPQALRYLYGGVHKDPAFEHMREQGVKFVPGEGPLPARVAILGEAPGAAEDHWGRPFVGQSGQLLDQMLAEIAGVSREDVFLSNIVKYRPMDPPNRAPTPDEVAASRPWVTKELGIVGPHVVLLLGRTAITTFFPGVRVGMVHGRPISRDRRVYLPAFHPSAALRSPEARQALTDDLAMLGQLVGTRTHART